MDAPISMSRATREAERLRRIRQHLTELPPGRHRDELHDQLQREARMLSESKLVTG